MSDNQQTVILITGPSGAGRTTTINALEDFGYESIDNIPMSLVPRLLEGAPRPGGMALGIDVRNRDFNVGTLLDLVAALRDRVDIALSLLYVDCAADRLIRRFSETRRRHPLSPDGEPSDGVRRELALLAPLRDVSDYLIDTSELTPHDLRAKLAQWFTAPDDAQLVVSLVSFSYKRGLPAGADMVFDCRFLKNPHWDPDLRAETGLSREVHAYIAEDGRFEPFLAQVTDMLAFLLPAQREEGKTHLTVGIGCTGGQHRSVAVTERVAHALAKIGWQVSIRHRELERRGLVAVSDGRVGDGKDGSRV
ncbi:RNase adapter RapZ [Roseivivax sp. CAU 1753]